MKTAAADFAQRLSEAWNGLPNEEALAALKVRRSDVLYRTSNCPEGADKVSDYLSELVGDKQATVLVGINTVNDKVYLIKLFKGPHGMMGYSFYLDGGWEEVFWFAGAPAEFAKEFSGAYARIPLLGTISAESSQAFTETAIANGYDTEFGVGNWEDAEETLRSLIVSSGGTLLQGE